MRKKPEIKSLLCFFIGIGTGIAAIGQETVARDGVIDKPLAGAAWGLALLLLFIFFGLVYLMVKIRTLGKAEQEAFSFSKWWAAMDARLLTKAIPLDKEADHLLDHDYDGIKELDNSLPPWWKYGFYITVVAAFYYLFLFHVWKVGLNPEQEYQQEIAMAEKQIDEYRKKAGDAVDEKTVTMADAKGIAEGAKIFQASCVACHGAKGEGGVGPNLTDAYWLHGGRINDVFRSIKAGIPDKGMQAWEKTYSPAQIRNIASYIRSISGTKPANGKAPQGDLFEEKAENPAAAKDTTVIASR